HSRSAHPGAEHGRHARRIRSDHQQLPDQSNHRASGQPDRSQNRPCPEREQRFFTRYSYEKTHRVLPATLPHGDAGFTFGAADGNITAQGLAFNDTHTFSANWLNEFRLGWSSIKFLMTPIDYRSNLAQKVGIPGVNLGEITSAMSQIMFINNGM